MARILIERVNRLNDITANFAILILSLVMCLLLFVTCIYNARKAWQIRRVHMRKNVSWEYDTLVCIYDDYLRGLYTYIQKINNNILDEHMNDYKYCTECLKKIIFFDEQQPTETSCIARFNMYVINIMLCINGILLLPLGIPYLYVNDVTAGTALICFIAISIGGIGSCFMPFIEQYEDEMYNQTGLLYILWYLIIKRHKLLQREILTTHEQKIKHLNKLHVVSARKALEYSRDGLSKACTAIVLCISAIAINVIDNTACLTIMAIVIGYAVEAAGLYFKVFEELRAVTRSSIDVSLLHYVSIIRFTGYTDMPLINTGLLTGDLFIEEKIYSVQKVNRGMYCAKITKSRIAH